MHVAAICSEALSVIICIKCSLYLTNCQRIISASSHSELLCKISNVLLVLDEGQTLAYIAITNEFLAVSYLW